MQSKASKHQSRDLYILHLHTPFRLLLLPLFVSYNVRIYGSSFQGGWGGWIYIHTTAFFWCLGYEAWPAFDDIIFPFFFLSSSSLRTVLLCCVVLCSKILSLSHIYIYTPRHTLTHTHTHIYIYVYLLYFKRSRFQRVFDVFLLSSCKGY